MPYVEVRPLFDAGAERVGLPPHSPEPPSQPPCTDLLKWDGGLLLVPVECADDVLPWDPEP